MILCAWVSFFFQTLHRHRFVICRASTWNKHWMVRCLAQIVREYNNHQKGRNTYSWIELNHKYSRMSFWYSPFWGCYSPIFCDMSCSHLQRPRGSHTSDGQSSGHRWPQHGCISSPQGWRSGWEIQVQWDNLGGTSHVHTVQFRIIWYYIISNILYIDIYLYLCACVY